MVACFFAALLHALAIAVCSAFLQSNEFGGAKLGGNVVIYVEEIIIK